MKKEPTIKCPYCDWGREYEDGDCGPDGDESVEECPECGKEFRIIVWVTTNWQTKCTQDNHEDDGEHRRGCIWCKNCGDIIGDDKEANI